MTEKCLLVLGTLGGEATTTQIRERLGEPGARVRAAMHSLTRRKQPPVELAAAGLSSHGGAHPGLWRLTEHGRAAAAGEQDR